MSGELSSVILLLCSIYRNNLAVIGSVINVTTTSLPGDNNVTTTSLPGDKKVTTTSLPGDNKVTTISLPGDNKVTTTSLPGDNNITTTSLPCDNNVTTTSLPGDNKVTTTSLPGDNNVTTTSLPCDNNVTTTSLPGDNKVTTTSLPCDNNVTTTSLPGDNKVTTTSLLCDNNVTTTSLPGDNDVRTTSLPGDKNVTTTSLPGDNNVTRTGKMLKELNINGHVDSTTLVPTDTASSDGACNSTFNCSSDHVDVTTVTDDPSVQWLLSPETYNAINPVIRIINTILYMLALILNSFNISVFMSHSRCSINCYLIAIRLLDILSAVCYSVGIIYIMVTSDDTSLFYSIFIICNKSINSAPVFQRIINCLVFLVSIERLIVVVYPLKAKEFVLMRRPKSIIMMAVLTTALFHIFSPLRYTVTATTDPTTNATIYPVVPSQLFLQNRAILRGMSTASKVLFVYTFLIGGLILNVLVVCALKHHSKKRQQMATTADTDKAAKRERQTTITIVTSSFVFLFLALPLSTNSIVYNLFPDVYGPNTPNYYVFVLVQSLSTLLSSLSLSTDFVAYFCLSTSFRTTLFRILHIKQTGSPSR